jgi:hypothetical protein
MAPQRERGTRSRRRELAAVVSRGVLAVLLSACAATRNTAAGHGPDDAGFWLGLWHGLIAPIAFLVSLFNRSVGVYEVHNSGAWYNFGFLLGLSIFFSSSGAGARGRSRSARRSR